MITGISILYCIYPSGLSYNRLSGEIPLFLQHIAPDVMDVSGGVHRDFSHNRLAGSLADTKGQFNHTYNGIGDIDTNGLSWSNVNGAFVALNVNRLSGDVPSHSLLRNMQQINILAGNIFACKKHSDLPQNDPHYHFYTCGSDAIDFPLLLWAALLGLGALLGTCLLVIRSLERTKLLGSTTHTPDSKMSFSQLFSSLRWSISKSIGNIRLWFAAIDELDPISNREVVQFKETLQFVRSTAFYITCFILSTFLVCYCVGKTQLVHPRGTISLALFCCIFVW